MSHDVRCRTHQGHTRMWHKHKIHTNMFLHIIMRRIIIRIIIFIILFLIVMIITNLFISFSVQRTLICNASIVSNDGSQIPSYLLRPFTLKQDADMSQRHHMRCDCLCHGAWQVTEVGARFFCCDHDVPTCSWCHSEKISQLFFSACHTSSFISESILCVSSCPGCKVFSAAYLVLVAHWVKRVDTSRPDQPRTTCQWRTWRIQGLRYWCFSTESRPEHVFQPPTKCHWRVCRM